MLIAYVLVAALIVIVATVALDVVTNPVNVAERRARHHREALLIRQTNNRNRQYQKYNAQGRHRHIHA